MIYVCLASQTHTHATDQLETEAGTMDVGDLLEKVFLKVKNWFVSSSQKENIEQLQHQKQMKKWICFVAVETENSFKRFQLTWKKNQ